MAWLWDHRRWMEMHVNQDGLWRLEAAVNDARAQLLGLTLRLSGEQIRLQEYSTLESETGSSSQIEGEHLNRDVLRASIARRLSLDKTGQPKPRGEVGGMVEMVVRAWQADRINAEDLLEWHRLIFPQVTHDGPRIIGAWRVPEHDPMQVISLRIQRPHTVHFEAPPASKLGDGVEELFNLRQDAEWLPGCSQLTRAAISHLCFLTLHPFEDGNGRIARAITEHDLSCLDAAPQRLWSFSAEAAKRRTSYYEILEHTQRQREEPTAWVKWFLECALEGLKNSILQLKEADASMNYTTTHDLSQLDDDERTAIQWMLRTGQPIAARRYGSLTRCSKATATRHLSDLERRGYLKRDGSGAATRYVLATLKPRSATDASQCQAAEDSSDN